MSSPGGLLSGTCARLSIAYDWVSRSNVHCTYVTITHFDIACQMASNYNLVPRPAVLLVDEGRIQVMERRETYHDLLARYGDI